MVKKFRYTPEWKPAKKDGYLPESLEGFKENLEAQLSEFRTVVSGLPSLPKHPIEYEGWFRDVKKRLEIDSQTRTTAAHVNALTTFNRLQEEWLKLGKMNYELSRVGARAKIDDLRIKAEEKELKLQMARTDAAIRELKTKKLDIVVQPRPAPQPTPPPPESYEERTMRWAKREFEKWTAENAVKDKIIREAMAKGKSEEDAKAFADEVIQKLRKQTRV
jgi:hypothetical protein